jgi:hypothetical protein
MCSATSNRYIAVKEPSRISTGGTTSAFYEAAATRQCRLRIEPNRRPRGTNTSDPSMHGVNIISTPAKTHARKRLVRLGGKSSSGGTFLGTFVGSINRSTSVPFIECAAISVSKGPADPRSWSESEAFERELSQAHALPL